jgi:hypothetical protein
MRLLIAAVTLILTVGAAFAQVVSPSLQGNSRIGQSAQRALETETTIKPKVNDKAYESALKNLPNKQYDPWHGVR